MAVKQLKRKQVHAASHSRMGRGVDSDKRDPVLLLIGRLVCRGGRVLDAALAYVV
jgi:hypothetical protein